MKLRIRHFKQHGQAVLASLLVGLVLLLDAMAAAPNLHGLIHPDQDAPGHECGVTIFAHSHVDSSVVEVAAVLPVVSFEFLPLASVSAFNALAESLPPGRGPPGSSLPSCSITGPRRPAFVSFLPELFRRLAIHRARAVWKNVK